MDDSYKFCSDCFYSRVELSGLAYCNRKIVEGLGKEHIFEAWEDCQGKHHRPDFGGIV